MCENNITKSKVQRVLSSGTPMLTRGDENDLLEDIKEGIQIALFNGIEEGRFEEAEIQLDPIRINKLAYIAVEELGLDLTFGWYKYGPAPYDVVAADSSQSTGPSIEAPPRASGDIQASTSSRLPSRGYYSSEEYAYFFLRELDEVFDDIVTAEDTKEYLVEFYEKYASKDREAAPFENLYIESAYLQQILDYIGHDTEWHDDAEQYFDRLDVGLTRVYGELLRRPELKSTVEPFQQYIRLIKDVISAAAAEQSLSESQQRYINRVVGAYYNLGWKYVALQISLQTMRGENVDYLRSETEPKLEALQQGDYDREIAVLRSRRANFGLGSNATENNEGSDESLNSDQNLNHVDAWTKLSMEVIGE